MGLSDSKGVVGDEQESGSIHLAYRQTARISAATSNGMNLVKRSQLKVDEADKALDKKRLVEELIGVSGSEAFIGHEEESERQQPTEMKSTVNHLRMRNISRTEVVDATSSCVSMMKKKQSYDCCDDTTNNNKHGNLCTEGGGSNQKGDFSPTCSEPFESSVVKKTTTKPLITWAITSRGRVMTWVYVTIYGAKLLLTILYVLMPLWITVAIYTFPFYQMFLSPDIRTIARLIMPLSDTTHTPETTPKLYMQRRASAQKMYDEQNAEGIREWRIGEANSTMAKNTDDTDSVQLGVPAPSILREHSKEFERQIIKAADNVYVAIGFGLANCVIINGTDGVIVIDTMESIEAMHAVWNAWQAFSGSSHDSRPLKGIIYSHFHSDHVFGASAIYRPNVTQVWAHELTIVEMKKVLSLTGGTTYGRSMRQFGVYVGEDDFVNAGIGPKLNYDPNAPIGTILPTHVMTADRLNISIAGVEIELIHAPGESKDQIIVWLRDKDVLFGADNIYKAFPNIYAIRGTEPRDCNVWTASLDLMRKLRPEVLLLGHTRPIHGKQTIQDLLLSYRDAIQFVHDQTLRYMNKGYFLNDIVHLVKLPPHLDNHPYLQELYGTIHWAVRAIHTQYVGWFSGSAEDLSMMSTLKRAESLAELAGGFDGLLNAATKALQGDNAQWALELSNAAYHLSPESADAKRLKIASLRAMAALQTASTGRNWYLTALAETEGTLVLKLTSQHKRQAIQHASNMAELMRHMPIRLDAENSFNQDDVLLFNFGDTKETICAHFRRGIVSLTEECERIADIEISTTAELWRSIMARDKSLAVALAKGEVSLKGSIVRLLSALSKVELDM